MESISEPAVPLAMFWRPLSDANVPSQFASVDVLVMSEQLQLYQSDLDTSRIIDKLLPLAQMYIPHEFQSNLALAVVECPGNLKRNSIFRKLQSVELCGGRSVGGRELQRDDHHREQHLREYGLGAWRAN